MKNNRSQGKIYIQESSFSVHDGKFTFNMMTFVVFLFCLPVPEIPYFNFINRNPKTLHAQKTVVR